MNIFKKLFLKRFTDTDYNNVVIYRDYSVFMSGSGMFDLEENHAEWAEKAQQALSDLPDSLYIKITSCSTEKQFNALLSYIKFRIY